MKELPDTELLNQLFRYEEDTGLVYWKVSKGSKAKAGSIAGSMKRGYIQVCIDRKVYQLHRVIWKLQTGEEPYPYQIDHRDRKKNNNRWNNLRLVSNRENSYNIEKKNKTGYIGVSSVGRKYRAKVWIGGKQVCLGLYNTPEEAHRVYREKVETLREHS